MNTLKLALAAFCLVVAGVLSAISPLSKQPLMEVLTVGSFALAIAIVAYSPRALWKQYWDLMDSGSSNAQSAASALNEDFVLNGIAVIVLTVMSISSVLSIWYNHTLTQVLGIFLAPVLVGVILNPIIGTALKWIRWKRSNDTQLAH